MPKVLVIGDSCLDIFVYCKVERLAPDLPIPVLEEIERTLNPGMAANVFRNLNLYLDDLELVTNTDWETFTKCRYVDAKTNYTFLRVDNRANKLESLNSLIRYSKYDYIVVSDYDKGFLNEQQISEICARHRRVFLDTKKQLGPWAKDAFLIKINELEFDRSRPFIQSNIENKVICTLGSRGATYLGKVYPVSEVKVFDTTGAGDAFFAGFLIKYFEAQDIFKAIQFGNSCASYSVAQRGTGLIC